MDIAALMESGTSAKAPRDTAGRNRIIDAVGHTPLIEIRRVAREVAPARIFAKAEWFNPGGSVKDRPALAMILDGERTGKLTPEKTLIDATSGNTGIAYAMIGAALGYRVKLCVPRNIGDLRRRILEAYGADLVLTNPQHGSDGAIREARRIHASDPDRYFYPDQYSNPANWRAHYEGTGPEIIRQTGGAVTHFVAGLGTTGTFTGTGRRLREHNPRIRLVAVQPDSPFHGLEGLKHLETSIVPGIYDSALPDETRTVNTEDAQRMVLRLAREEGLFVGLSAGAAMVAALALAKDVGTGTIVAIFADGGHKYLDMAFWTTGAPATPERGSAG